MSSAIFEGYKAIGLVTNHIPFIVRYHHKLDDLRILACAGRSFHSFDSRLRLLESSHEHDSDITCMDSDSEYVYTAAGCHVYAWKHGHRWLQHTYGGHKTTIKHLLAFGPYIISVDQDNVMLINEIKSEKFVVEMSFGSDVFDISCVMHPATYLNKILLGCKQGKLKLLNIKSLDVVYEFKGWDSRVMVVEQSPAVDVVGIGLMNGLIILHNLKFDESLMKFKQEWAPVTAISFRTDGPPLMITASQAGHAVIWDLEKQKVSQQLRSIHSGPVEGAKYLVNERLLVTSSSDNSLRIWSFSDFEEEGRLLHERDGHSEPPTCTKFYGMKGHHILSSGLDSTLRCFSTLSERMNRNFGYASYNRKYAKKVGAKKDPNRMPPVISFCSEETRAKDWDNILAIHQGLSVVTSWTFDKARMGDHKLLPKSDTPKNLALCSTITSCGNFAIVGYKSGQVERFNLQSGLHRHSYGSQHAHVSSVHGVVCDKLNQMVVSGSVDGLLKLWSFKVGNLLSAIDVKSPILKMIINRENSLVALALGNHRLKIFDIETRRIIRFLPSHRNEITDLTFSPDGKWLIVATKDRFIRTWDLSRSKLVDSFLMKKACRSLDMSSTGEFLVTSHFDDLGVYLWSNITLFTPTSLKPIDIERTAMEIDFPHVRPDDLVSEETDFFIAHDLDQDQEMKVEISEYKSPEQIAQHLITLSLQPTSKWKNLLNIDLIKKRNKPKDPPKPAAPAPFFLPTISSLNPSLNVPKTDAEKQKDEWRAVARLRGLSKFGELLMDCSKTTSYEPVFQSLKEMGPSAIDVELRCLEIPISLSDVPGADEESPILLKYFMQAMSRMLDSRMDFELVQGFLSLYLKIHSETIMKTPLLIAECDELQRKISTSWNELDDAMKKSLCVINYLRSAVI